MYLITIHLGPKVPYIGGTFKAQLSTPYPQKDAYTHSPIAELQSTQHGKLLTLRLIPQLLTQRVHRSGSRCQAALSSPGCLMP